MRAGQSDARPVPFSYTEDEIGAAREAAQTALKEDLGELGDVTTTICGSLWSHLVVEAAFVTRVSGVLAGTRAAEEVFCQLDSESRVDWLVDDGDEIEPGMTVGVVEGRAGAVLAGERSALNLLCHLSGVATLTRQFVCEIERASDGCRLRDTRKTTPGLRFLEKAAVRAGGGTNHRIGLADGVLVKDNHLAILNSAQFGSSLAAALDPSHRADLVEYLRDVVATSRERLPDMEVEIEADTTEMVEVALEAGPDVVLCDNMNLSELARAVALTSGRCALEASGGVTLKSAAEIAATGVDFIAVGAVTHSAPALDIGLDFVDQAASDCKQRRRP